MNPKRATSALTQNSQNNWAFKPSILRRSLNSGRGQQLSDARIFEIREEKHWTPWSGEPLSTPVFYALGVAIMSVSFWVSGGHALFTSDASKTQARIETPEFALNPALDIRDVTWDIRYRASKPILFVTRQRP